MKLVKNGPYVPKVSASRPITLGHGMLSNVTRGILCGNREHFMSPVNQARINTTLEIMYYHYDYANGSTS